MVGHRGETGEAYHCYTLCAGFPDDSAGGRKPSVVLAGRWLWNGLSGGGCRTQNV